MQCLTETHAGEWPIPQDPECGGAAPIKHGCDPEAADRQLCRRIPKLKTLRTRLLEACPIQPSLLRDGDVGVERYSDLSK